jgi:hypothetical protein
VSRYDAVLAAIGIGLLLGISLDVFARAPKPQRVASRINTALYDLAVTTFRNYIPRPETNQGGISLFADGYLLTTGDGDVFVYRRSEDHESISVERIPTKVPINTAEFLSAAAGSAVILNWFRVADILAQESAETFRLFVTHHYYKVEEGCWVMRVSALDGRYDNFDAHAKDLLWTTIFEAKPCVPLATKEQPMQFEGLFNGGRMVLLDENELLVSFGAHGLRVWYGKTPQAPDSSYGKTVPSICGMFEPIYSSGHLQSRRPSRTRRNHLKRNTARRAATAELIRRDPTGWPLAT